MDAGLLADEHAAQRASTRAGVAMARTDTPPEVKAQAIADLLTGEQPAIVAQRYGLPGGTVRQWKNRLVTPDVTDSVTSGVTKPGRTVTIRPQIDAQQLEIGALVMEALRAKVIATQRIAEYVTQPAWFDKQTAAEVAELFEVLDRSAVSILDRLSRHRSDDAADG